MAACARCGWKVRRWASYCAVCGRRLKYFSLFAWLFVLAMIGLWAGTMLVAGCGAADGTGGAAAVTGAVGPPVRFAGLDDHAERIIYVLDATAADSPTWPYAQAELLGSINALAPGQRFAVIFFGTGQPESLGADGRAGLIEATADGRRAARRFVLAARRGGPADERAPGRAMALAFELLERGAGAGRAGPAGRGDLIVLLAQRRWEERLADRIGRLNAAGGARIDTVGFLDPHTRPLLSRIAEANGGRFHFIEAVDLGKKP